MKNEKKIVEMINKFQCPGCVYGEDTESCSEFNIVYKSCGKHVIGTSLFPGGSFMLAMPKGFNKAGVDIYGNSFNKVNIDFCADTDEILNDYLNVPMWAMEKDGYLFIRGYSPRVNRGYIQVIEGGALSDVPNAIDVSQFVDDID